MATQETRPFYNSRAWKIVRDRVKQRDGGLCVICRDHGLVVPGSDVDHIRPLAERPDLGLVEDNLRLLCKSCHSVITQAAAKPTPAICSHGYPMGVCCEPQGEAP